MCNSTSKDTPSLRSTISTTVLLHLAQKVALLLWKSSLQQWNGSIPLLTTQTSWEFFAWTSFKIPAKGKHDELSQISHKGCKLLKSELDNFSKVGSVCWKAFWCWMWILLAFVACVLSILKSKLVHNAWCANIYMHWTFHPFNSTPKMLTSFLGENCLRERELCDRKQFQFQSRRSWLPDKTGSLWQTSLSGSFPKQKNSARFFSKTAQARKRQKRTVSKQVLCKVDPVTWGSH